MLRSLSCLCSARAGRGPAAAASYSANRPPRPRSASSRATSSGIAAPPPARAQPTRAARWCCASRSPSAPAGLKASSSTAAHYADGDLARCNASAKGRQRQAARRPISLPRGRRNLPLRPLPSFALAQKRSAPPILEGVLRQYELVEKVRSYDPDADEGLINRAYVFSMKAHGVAGPRLGRPLFQPSDRGRRDPHRFEARRPDDRHRDPPRYDRGHARDPGRDREDCSARTSRGWSTG